MGDLLKQLLVRIGQLERNMSVSSGSQSLLVDVPGLAPESIAAYLGFASMCLGFASGRLHPGDSRASRLRAQVVTLGRGANRPAASRCRARVSYRVRVVSNRVKPWFRARWREV